MKIQQLSIFVENKAGRLAEITETLAAENVDIRAISVADTCDFGILRLIVDKPEEAVAALSKKGIAVTMTSVLAIGVDDRPGALAEAMRVFAAAGISVEYLYAFVSRENGMAYVILRVDDERQAEEVLRANGFPILAAEQIHGM